jgi:hypothetical protein
VREGGYLSYNLQGEYRLQSEWDYPSPYSNIVPCQIGPPQQVDIEGAGMEQRHTREGGKIVDGSLYMEVGIDDEAKESMDEGNNVRYLRIN